MSNGRQLVNGDGVTELRRWQPQTLPGVEVVEAHQTLFACRALNERYVFALRTDGASRVRCQRRVHDQLPGETLLLEPGATHEVLHAGKPTSAVVLLLPQTLVSQVAREYCGYEREVHWRSVIAPRGSLGVEMLALVKALPTLSSLQAKASLSRLIATFIAQFADDATSRRDSDRPVESIARARELLHARSSESVTLDELVVAAQCATVQQLIRGFREAFGFTPHAYQTQLRLQRARELLRSGHDCGETAHAVGFYDQSQLNRHFVKHVGITPGTYAKAMR